MNSFPPITTYDPFADATMAEPASTYDFLHSMSPVDHFEAYDPEFYRLSKYDDVLAALMDIETFSSEFGQGPRFSPPAGMLSNPPDHTFFRGLVQKAFTPKSMKALAPRVLELAHELLDKVEGRGEFDVHEDYGFPLPVTIIAEVLGVPDGDHHLFKRWSDASVEAMGSVDPTPYMADMTAMSTYLASVIADRRANPRDDLVTRLVQVETDGQGLDNDDILSITNQLLVGGNETTTSLITNCIWRLLQNPDLWQRLVDDPSLVNRAIEESLRYDPPVLGLYRNTTRDVELRGQVIPEGSKVMLHYAAANRDPEAYENAHTFSLDRPPSRHLAFGLGVHFCLGSELARLEARTALATLVERFPTLSLVGDGERIKPFFLWGRKTLPVQV
jgi:cytochrome P450